MQPNWFHGELASHHSLRSALCISDHTSPNCESVCTNFRFQVYCLFSSDQHVDIRRLLTRKRGAATCLVSCKTTGETRLVCFQILKCVNVTLRDEAVLPNDCIQKKSTVKAFGVLVTRAQPIYRAILLVE